MEAWVVEARPAWVEACWEVEGPGSRRQVPPVGARRCWAAREWQRGYRVQRPPRPASGNPIGRVSCSPRCGRGSRSCSPPPVRWTLDPRCGRGRSTTRP